MFSFLKRKKQTSVNRRSEMPRSLRRRECGRSVVPVKKRWKDMTDSERRRQVRERDAQIIKDCKETERKLKSAARKGGKAVGHAIEGLGIIANVVADTEKKGIKKAVKEGKKAVKEGTPVVKMMAKDVGKAGKKALDGIGRMVDNHDRYYAKREKAARKAAKKTTKRRTVKRKGARKVVVVRNPPVHYAPRPDYYTPYPYAYDYAPHPVKRRRAKRKTVKRASQY